MNSKISSCPQKLLFVLAALSFLQLSPGIAVGDDAAAKKPGKVRLSFRTNKKTSLHIHSAKEADETEKVLKQLGCEVTRAEHDGHIDLAFECKFWKTLNLKDQAESAKWNEWLVKHNFAIVENTPPKTRKETVQYQLKDWRTVHLNNDVAAKAYLEMFKMLGCEVTTAKHDGHEDIKYRCTTWQDLGVSSHALAHAWMAELKKLGFATMHEH